MSPAVEELSPNYLSTGPSGRFLSCVVLKFQLSLDLILLQWILLFSRTYIWICWDVRKSGPGGLLPQSFPSFFVNRSPWRSYQNTPSNPEDLGRSLELCIF